MTLHDPHKITKSVTKFWIRIEWTHRSHRCSADTNNWYCLYCQIGDKINSLVTELGDNHDGAERLFSSYEHVILYICEHCGFQKKSCNNIKY